MATFRHFRLAYLAEEACLSAPEEESAAAKDEKYHEDDEDRVGVHWWLMLAEPRFIPV